MNKKNNELFYNILKEYDTAMLVCNAGERFNGRPMAIAFLEENCDLWFFSSDTTEKIEEILKDPRVLVTCQKDHGSYISLSGMASVVHDKGKLKEFWKESYKIWFPQGIEDPNIALISVKAESGEYWDNRGSKGVSFIFNTIKAYVTGTTPKIKEGEQHGKVTL